MALKVCLLGAVRRRTFICCRNIQISTSSAVRDRNRSATIQTMSLTRRPILDQLLVRLSLRQGQVLAFADQVEVPAAAFISISMKVQDTLPVRSPPQSIRNCQNSSAAAQGGAIAPAVQAYAREHVAPNPVEPNGPPRDANVNDSRFGTNGRRGGGPSTKQAACEHW
jgi:hypothetical protein